MRAAARRAAVRVGARLALAAGLLGCLAPAAAAQAPFPRPAIAPAPPGRTAAPDELAATLRGVRVGQGAPAGRLVATVALAGPAARREVGAAAFHATVDGRPARVARAEPLTATGGRVAVVLAVDTSFSMRTGGNIGLAKAAADDFAAELRPGTDVGVVAFATRSRVVQPPTSDRRRVRAALAGLHADGRTALHDAVVQAAGLLAGLDGQRNLVLLSDGKDDGSRATLAAAVAAARRARVTVYTIGLTGPEQDPATLRALAVRTGGRAVTGASGADLAGLYRRLGRELASQYLVEVELPPGAAGTVGFGLQVRAGGATARAGRTLLLGHRSAPVPALQPAPPLALLETGAGRWLAAALAFAALLLAGVAVAAGPAAAGPGGQLHQRLAPYSLPAAAPGPPRPAGFRSSELAGRAGDLAESLVRRGHLEPAIADRLEAAGLELRVAEAALAWLGVVVGLPLLAGGATRNPVVALLAAVVGMAGPPLVLANRAARRRARFAEQLPGALQLLAGALQAGHSLLQAAGTVVAEADDPIAGELQRALTEARLGRPFEESLEALAARMGSLDFKWTVMAIDLQRQVGGNLAEVLTTVAQTIRERATLQRQVRALSAEGRLSALILAVLPPAVFAALLAFNRGFLAPLLTTRTGLALLVGSALLLVVGIAWLRKLTQVEV